MPSIRQRMVNLLLVGVNVKTVDFIAKNDALGQANGKLSRDDWVETALAIFAEKGIDAVRVEPLAQSLNVTKGSFYWHFKNRHELHQAIIDHWAERCSTALARCFDEKNDIIDVVLNVFAMWMQDEPFSPKLDAAMRDWAHRSTAVRKALKRADNDRVEALAAAFQRAGFEGDQALVRARVLYYTQLGYYEADLREPRQRRIELWREYVSVITGQELSVERLAEFRNRHFTAQELL